MGYSNDDYELYDTQEDYGYQNYQSDSIKVNMQASFSQNTAAYAANTGNDECHVCYEDTVSVAQRQQSSDQCDQQCTQSCNVLAESLENNEFNDLDLPTRQQMIENARKIIAETLLKDNEGTEPALIMPEA